MSVTSQNPYVEILIPKTMTLGDGALGGIMKLGMEPVPLLKRLQRDLSVPSHMSIQGVDSLQPGTGLSTLLAP